MILGSLTNRLLNSHLFHASSLDGRDHLLRKSLHKHVGITTLETLLTDWNLLTLVELRH